MRPRLLYLLVVVALAAACQPEIPPLPNVTVVITAVSDEAALAAAVEDALTATAQRQVALTETALALGGITRTPSPTPTATLTPPLPSATPFLSPTPTATPTVTPTLTLAPLATNTPVSLPDTPADSAGRLRVLHALRLDGLAPVEVYIDDVRVARGMGIGDDSGYFTVNGPSARVTVRLLPELLGGSEGQDEQPLASSVVSVGPGASVSVVLTDLGGVTPTLVAVRDETVPLATGFARLTLLQGNTFLLRANALMPGLSGALAFNMNLGDQAGPFDVPAGSYSMSLYDADSPDQLITTISGIRLDSYVNYLLVLVPAADPAFRGDSTEYLLFPGSTARAPGDVALYFINAAPSAGTLTIGINDLVLVNNLPVGQKTVALPLSSQGGTLVINDTAGANLMLGGIGPFATPNDHIVVIMDAASAAAQTGPLQLAVFPMNAAASSARASVRLIHGLSGTNRTLDLELRATSLTEIESIFGVPPGQQESTAFVPVIQGVRLATASDYAGRVPAVFDVRVVLSGTQSVQGVINSLQLLAGGVYDFVIVPGDTPGVARLLLVQPEVQVAGPGINRADPDVMREQVEMALTELAPAATATSTAVRTATPTSSPVPTNTPRPSNTPSFPPPALLVDPVPPAAAVNSFMLTALNFKPESRYTISLAGGPENLSGSTGLDGSFLREIAIPAGLRPGAYTVRVCVDCRAGGAQQEEFAVFVVADPARTPTATPLP